MCSTDGKKSEITLGLAVGIGACALLFLASCKPSEDESTAIGADENDSSAIQTYGNWIAPNADDQETAYSPLNQIDTATVNRLGLSWSLDLPGEVSLEATPLAIDGVLYFTGTNAAVYAVDGLSGKVLWKYDPETWKFNPDKMLYGFAANRGVAYAKGRIFFAAQDGRLFALDAKTGNVLWSVETVTRDSLYASTGAPRTFNGKVIIGNNGADYGLRGYVTAYDAETGEQIWRFFTVPGKPEENRGDAAMELAAETWGGEYWKTGTGGGVWNGITFDADLNHIYIATANASPYDPSVRSPGGGDNLYTASIVALDADTGGYVWHYQINPRDAWDYDSTEQMTIADLVIDGQARKVLMQSPKNGFYYVLDRHTGKVISAEKIGKVTWAERIDLVTGRPVEAENIRYETDETIVFPAGLGAHVWMAMSYSPQTGLVYIPYMQLGARFVKGELQPDSISIGGISVKEYMTDPLDGKGALLAWDPVQQREAWKVPHDTLWNGGTMSTAGNLVFQGTANGYLTAYNATSGDRVWRFNAGLGIIAAPMSYAVNGTQYVSILVGYGGSVAAWGNLANVGWKFTSPRRLLTFALDGNAEMPASPPPDLRVYAVDDPSLELDPAPVDAGRNLAIACIFCHGRDLVSAGTPAPDLRESEIALDPEALWQVLHDGALVPKGMPKYSNFSREQVAQIWAYIRARARETLAQQESD